MTATELKSQMLNLQNRMEGLQIIEAKAYADKLEAERKISECGLTWYSVWKEYMKCKEKLADLTKQILKTKNA